MEKEIEQKPEEEGGAVAAPVEEPAAQEPAAQAPAEVAKPVEARAAPASRPPRVSGEAPDERPRGRGRFRRRVCAMCENKMPFVDYKDFAFLRRFISDRGRIESRRKSGTCAKHQRALAQAIKRARHLALLPYAPEHIRVSGVQVGR